MKNNNAIIFIIVLGAVMTLFMFFTLNASGVWAILFNILSMLGSGVFCSGVVSLLLEKKNYRQTQKKNKEIKKAILLEIHNSIEILIIIEYSLIKENVLCTKEALFKLKEIEEKRIEDGKKGILKNYDDLFINKYRFERIEDVLTIEKRNIEALFILDMITEKEKEAWKFISSSASGVVEKINNKDFINTALFKKVLWEFLYKNFELLELKNKKIPKIEIKQ